MSAHTPGPWRIDPEFRCDVQTSDGAIEIATALVPQTFGDTQDVETVLANARVIASAPALLASLLQMLDRYTTLVNSGDAGHWDPEKEAEVIAARAAIAQARGY